MILLVLPDPTGVGVKPSLHGKRLHKGLRKCEKPHKCKVLSFIQGAGKDRNIKRNIIADSFWLAGEIKMAVRIKYKSACSTT